MISVLIVDDHPVLAQGLAKALSDSGSLHVCDVAPTGAKAKELFELHHPDVVLLDIKLPDDSGLDLCKYFIGKVPEQKIVVLTSYNQRYYIESMLQNGAMGYLLKNAEPSEIIEAIICVAEGESYFCREVKEILKNKDQSPIFISKRELEVLRLIAQGMTNQDIADKLFISPLTVDSHRKNLIMKLGAKNTASLIHIASQDGLI